MRKLVLAIVLLLLITLGVAAAAFFQYTTVDKPIRARLQPALSQLVQERLRPLRAPEVLRFSPRWDAEDVGPRAPVSISFLTDMDHASTEANIHIEPCCGQPPGGAIAGSFEWHAKTVTFTPAEPWPLNTEITVRVDRNARSQLYRRMIEPFQWSFHTLGPPRIVETEPAQDAHYAYTDNRIGLRFNRLMDRASVESRLRIQPEPLNMALEWQGEQLLIGGAFRPSTGYTVSLLKGAQDAVYGLATEEDLTWSFTTTERYPYLAIVGTGRFAAVPAGQPAQLMLNLVNISQIDFKLYRIDVPAYLQMTSFRYDDWLHFDPQAEPLRTWTIKPDIPTDEETQRPLEIDGLEPGLYFLTATAPEAAAEGQVLIAGQTALTLKRSPTQVLAWATRMDDGAPVAGLSLQAYNSAGELIAEGQTDEDGLWFTRFAGESEQIHLIATAAGDFAAASDFWQQGIEPWQFEGVQWQGDFRPRAHRVFLYTDRPIYRPGQTVHFKGVVRRDRAGEYEQPPAGTPVQVKITNWTDDVLYDRTLETTPFGSISDSFDLGNEVGLGQWRLLALIDGEEYETTFQIEEYRKPEYAVDVRFDVGARQVGPMVHEQSDLLSDLPRPYYVNGDTFQATVNARYFFGAPAAGAQIRWTLYANDYDFPFADESFRDFAAQPLYFGYGREIARGEGLADDSGTFVVSQMADITSEDRSQVFTLEAEVTDPAAQPVSGVASVLIHRGEFYIGVRPENYVAEAGTSTRFKVRTLDVAGNPVADDLAYTIEQVSWKQRKTEACTEPCRSDGFFEWDEVRTPVTQGSFATDTAGDGVIAFTPEAGGSYEVRVRGTDTRGNRVLGFGWLWVSEPGRLISWHFGNNDRIDLVADARTYRVGDTARVLVQSPYQAATALVTVERAGILDYRVVELNSNSAAIEVPIEERFFPNVYVSTVLISRDGAPGFKVGYTELRVQSDEHRINVEIETDQDEYRPRDPASYTIRTTDMDRNPVPAEVSIGVVDAAIYSLTGAGAPDIVDAFYGRQPLVVRTAGSLAVLASRRIRPENPGGGGGPGETGVRRLFPDVAYWNPTVMTGENGMAEVSFPLPDNLTTWRATALGTTADTRVGQAQADAVVTKDLIVRPVLPRFFRVGDQASIGAIVQNFTGRPQSVDVSLSTTNLDFPDSLQTRSFVIGQGQAVRVDWPVDVPEAAEATITMRATAPGASDAVETTLPIEPFGEKVVDADAGQTEGLALVNVELPEDARFPRLHIDTAPSLAAGLIDALDYLTGFPYGCVEQTMSRFLPDVLVAQTLRKLGLSNPEPVLISVEGLEANLPAQVEKGLQRLYRFQHFDGGWGWWESDDTGAFQTAYVVYGLVQAKRAGFAVRDDVLERGAQALRTPLVETDNLGLKAYITYVLTEYGEGDIALARSLLDRQAQLAPYSRAYLALTLAKLGDEESAKAIVDDLARQVVETETTAHWTEKKSNWQLMSSDGRTTALALQAMLTVDPNNPLIPKSVRWLMSRRLGGYWRTTQETAAIIIALTDYLATTGELQATFDYTVSVNGRPAGQVKVTPDNIAQHHEFTITSLRSGGNEVRIEKSGAGTVYFATDLRYVLPRDTIAAERSASGPAVRRQYLDPEIDKPIESANVGDLIRVKLTVEAPTDMWYVQIEDPLPAGAEAVNFTLQTTGFRGRQPQYLWARPELRDEKAVFFSTFLWKGTHEYSYLIRATTAGEFRVRPAVATPMYEPEVWGRSDSAVLEVHEQEIARR